MSNLEMRGMADHHPQREDQVEAWIKDRRDAYPRNILEENNGEWHALDVLLDEYREAADTGKSLEVVVNGESERPKRGALKKKKEEK